ncbi:MAG: hypothetical protein WA941_09375 [Nitrososphaeraceae archaeon]
MRNNIQDLIMTEYQSFKKRITELIPRMDTDLILEILKFQTMKDKWPGSVTLRIKYKRNLETDIDTKKKRLYEKYKMLPSEIDDRTLRFKALGVYLKDITELSQDPDVEHISGSAEPSQKDQYASAQ